MRYKVGDRVRVRKDLEVDKMYDDIRFADGMKKLRGQIVTITEVYDYNGYYIKEDNGWFYWSEDMLEPVAEYTYEDLCNAPVGTKVTFETRNKTVIKTGENNLEDELGVIKIYNLKGLKNNGSCWGKIIKIEEPSYTTVYEAKKEILDEKEKEYLSNVIKPFKENVRCIEKHNYYDGRDSYLMIKYKNDIKMCFPDFPTETMYKGMKADREYNLEELGLN